MKTETVFVGLSGGVDSSVAALRLLKAGKRVVGVFIKVWQPDFIVCEWEKERLDAMRVAAHLNIPFITFDAAEVYKNEVVDYMVQEYRVGRTPNPDVMCNAYVKFGAFYAFARANGADKIATGHYAQVAHTNDEYHLLRGIDVQKDQSYFLWRLGQDELAHTYFPIGDTVKFDIRREAQKAGIPIFAKHDSQGICFLGQVQMDDFLAHYVPRHEGAVLDTNGVHIGTHTGALFYTQGQRHGFMVHPEKTDNVPLYVIGKDMVANTITVDTKPRLCTHDTIQLTKINVIGNNSKSNIEAQFRYRQKPFSVSFKTLTDTHAILKVRDGNIDAPMSGQSCVLYDDARCLGGGIID